MKDCFEIGSEVAFNFNGDTYQGVITTIGEFNLQIVMNSSTYVVPHKDAWLLSSIKAGDKISFIVSRAREYGDVTNVDNLAKEITVKTYDDRIILVSIDNPTIIIESDKVGMKFDDGKLQWTLLPITPLQEVIKVLMFGAKKYRPDNWKHVPNAEETYLNAGMRHLTDYINGEKNDSQTGLSHLAHAICCLLFILWFDLNKQFAKKVVDK